MEEQKTPENQPSHIAVKKSKTPVFIVVIILLLAAVIFFYMQNQQLEEKKEKQFQEILLTQSRLDSVGKELDARIQAIKELGGEVDTLQMIKAQLETDKKQFLLDARYRKGRITKLNNRVNGYKELLVLKDEEIKQLKVLNEQISEENTLLKVEKIQLNETVQQLEENKKELNSKVAYASRLQLTDVQINAINASGKERDGGEYKNKHIKQLKIQFTVVENKIAPIEGKDLLLRVIGNDGNALFDVASGSGSFVFENREMFYTAKKEILYDRESQLVTFLYNKGSIYASGQYQVEIYTDDYLIGKGSFYIK